jgi:hypothetical protein
LEFRGTDKTSDKAAKPANLPTPIFQAQGLCNILGICYGIEVKLVPVLASTLKLMSKY